MIKQNNFLIQHASKWIDTSLPLRFQKRMLLKKLGFSLDPTLKQFNISEIKNNSFEKYISTLEYPFVIITSPFDENYLPAYYYVENKNTVTGRIDEGDSIKSLQEVIDEIKNYDIDIYIECAKPIWNENTVAGRILFNKKQKIIELERGVIPRFLGKNTENNNYFTIEISSLEDHPYTSEYKKELEVLIDNLKKNIDGIYILEEISSMPTLEFAILNNQVIYVDVDWPLQWKKKKYI